MCPARSAHVCAFLASYAVERKATTTQRAAMAIGKAHRLAGLVSPVDHEHVRRTLAGLRRTKGMALRQALPLCTDDVARFVTAAPGGLRGVRDRAFLLVGFVGAFRVGELVALDAEDLDARTEGIVAHVRRAKTDQEGRGRIKPLPLAPERIELCPVRALHAWQHAAGIASGPLWRGSPRAAPSVQAGSPAAPPLTSSKPSPSRRACTPSGSAHTPSELGTSPRPSDATPPTSPS